MATKDEERVFVSQSVRDPPPVWDGRNPAERWPDKRRELLMWSRDTDIAKEKLGARFWRYGIPDGSPAKVIVNSMEDDDILGENGFNNIIAMFDSTYRGFEKVKKEKTFEEALFGKTRPMAQTFIEFTCMFQTEIQEYEKDGKMKLTEKLKVRLLLRRANLSETQRDKVETWAAGKTDDLAVLIECLCRLDDPRYRKTSQKKHLLRRVL